MAASSPTPTLSKLLAPLLPSTSSSPPSELLSLPQAQRVNLPKITSTWAPPADAITLGPTSPSSSIEIAAVVFPSLVNSNAFFFKSAYNVQVVAEENEPEEKLLSRFRREVFKAGVLQECRRRRFFENTHDKRKRKTRDAARRNRKRYPQSKSSAKAKQETLNPNRKKEADEENDNWDHFDVDLPY